MVRSPTSRRAFLTSLLFGSTALFGSGALARTISSSIPWSPGFADVPQGLQVSRFFTTDERECVAAIAARLIPSDDSGPGARDAGVVDFIDSQLAGFYGRGERWYMRGPFQPGTDEQGFQSELAPAALYRRAVASLDKICRAQFAGRRFADIAEHEQDEILKKLEDGEIALDDAPAKTFFTLVRENTIEGFFCDPIYGGNRNMVGWRLVGFPGARYDYRDFLDHNGSPIEIEPVGLAGRPAWNSR